MHWADKLAKNIIDSGKHQPYWVDDMKTPSGVIHVGSLTGVMIHDLVYKSLRKLGKEAKYTYIYNDMDPMDKLPAYLDKEIYTEHLGKPFFQIPAPDGKSESYAKQFANLFTETMNKIGAEPEILWSSELYATGKMNEVIKVALEKVESVRRVYLEVAEQEKPEGWYPFQVICPECGKLGSTLVTDWNGELVTYKCMEDMVSWAKGCGHEGKISPFNGTGKLMWKVDWPAHWKALGITIEGAGKDHSSDGGSRDFANALLKSVFDKELLYDIPYEWFLIAGRKMSTSKAVGTPAHEFVDLLPPTIARFVFVRRHYNKQSNFDPYGDTVPDLYDEYDSCAEKYWDGVEDDFATMYQMAQVGEIIEKWIFMPRFRDLARLLQDPKVDLKAKMAEIKGSELSEQELVVLDERVKYAKIWLEKYAPEEFVVKLNVDLPDSFESLSDEQVAYLKQVRDLLDKDVSDPDQLQQDLYNLSKDVGVQPKAAFQAIYKLLINKNSGPKAAWLICDNLDAVRELMRKI